MKVNNDILLRYISMAPMALALERTLECQIFRRVPFRRPVLDLGCGEGLFAKILFAEKIDTGINIDKRELERARELDTHLELIHCEGHRIPKPDESYKTIFSNSTLEHIPAIGSVLKEVYRLLAPGGYFYFTAPSDQFDKYTIINSVLSYIGLSNLAQRYRKFYNTFWKHYHYYSLKQWQNLVSQYSFEIVESYTYNPRRICMLCDFFIPFSLPSFMVRKITNRWIVFPTVRRIIMLPISLMFENILKRGGKCENGGLIFMELKKQSDHSH